MHLTALAASGVEAASMAGELSRRSLKRRAPSVDDPAAQAGETSSRPERRARMAPGSYRPSRCRRCGIGCHAWELQLHMCPDCALQHVLSGRHLNPAERDFDAPEALREPLPPAALVPLLRDM